MPTAAEVYAAKVDAVAEQRARLLPPRPESGDRWARRASFFRLDPRRELDANTAALVGLVGPLDTVIDIGGGAGRVGLAAALKCSEVLNVEPSAGMREQFHAAAAEAGITNARSIDASWPHGAHDLSVDVVITSNVTYFVRDILAFLEAMDTSADRLCAITVWSVPPPDRGADVFQIIHDEPLARTPTHLDLMGCLWELGILPDLKVLPDQFRGFRAASKTRDEAIDGALETVEASGIPGARERIERNFDSLFSESGGEIRTTWFPSGMKELLITWTPRSAQDPNGRG